MSERIVEPATIIATPARVIAAPTRVIIAMGPLIHVIIISGINPGPGEGILPHITEITGCRPASKAARSGVNAEMVA